jgi:hypothetical protein
MPSDGIEPLTDSDEICQTSSGEPIRRASLPNHGVEPLPFNLVGRTLLDRLDHDAAVRVVGYLQRRFPCIAHDKDCDDD